MRTVLFAVAGVGLAGLACFLIFEEEPHAAPPVKGYPPSPAVVHIDPAEVFRKAFWQLPGAGDKILQAERQEWTDSTGAQRWQWFLVVEPSTELVKYLREENAFGLVPTRTIPPITGAPTWFAFRPEDVDVLHARHGGLKLIFHRTKRLLLATSGGSGFQPGAPEVVKETKAAEPGTGRLPRIPPPKP